jgi:PII interaction protein X
MIHLFHPYLSELSAYIWLHPIPVLFALMIDPLVPKAVKAQMNTETYLNHPTFGLLFRICLVEENRELFATLYAQRLFFLVTTGTKGIQFEPISRGDARILVESRMRELRRLGQQQEYNELQATHKRTFQ